MTKILAIAGSYRKDGVIDQAIQIAARQAEERGAEVEVVQLRDYPIEFCRNCRECIQLPGDAPGECVLRDGMRVLLAKIEAADAFILASPTNVYAVTALFKRFMERLVVYSYWPWGAPAPKLRKSRATKKALVITSSAAPALIGRLFFGSVKGLKATATLIGAKRVRAVCVGLAAKVPDARLGASDARCIERAVAAML
jgi:multimeric flavodoxin WrbA